MRYVNIVVAASATIGILLVIAELLPGGKTPRASRLPVVAVPLLFVVLGALAVRQGWYFSAQFPFYNQAVQTNPESALALTNRGLLKKDREKNLAGAMEDFNAALALCPYFIAYNDRGMTRGELGDPRGAIDDFTKAIALRATCEVAYNNRGYWKEEIGDIPGAVRDYNTAIVLLPNYPDPYNNRGLIKAKNGDLDGAEADFSKALSCNTGYWKARMNLGGVKLLRKDTAGACREWLAASQDGGAMAPALKTLCGCK